MNHLTQCPRCFCKHYQKVLGHISLPLCKYIFFSNVGLSLVGGYCKRLKSKNNIIISELDGYTEFGDQAISCNVDTIFTFHWGIGEA